MLAAFSRANTWLLESRYLVDPFKTTAPIVPAEHSKLLPVEVPHWPVLPGLAYALTSPTTRTSVWTPSTVEGTPVTPARRVRTSTARRPFEARPVPVPITSGIFMSSGVCAFCARMASATSAGGRAATAALAGVRTRGRGGGHDH